MSTISVVIPTLNEESYVGGILADLAKQTVGPLEIVVVDAQSLDRTKKIVHAFPGVKFIEFERSVSRQRNKGAAQVNGDVIVFLDADTRIKESFLGDVIADFEKRGLDVACPLYVSDSSNVLTRLMFWYVNVIFILLQTILPSGAGPCIVVKREVFCAQFGFKEEQNFEDMEWIRRVGGKYRFGIILKKVVVSDRRFRTYGMFRMIVLYVILSFLFTFGLFSLANRLQYSFGKYKTE